MKTKTPKTPKTPALKSDGKCVAAKTGVKGCGCSKCVRVILGE